MSLIKFKKFVFLLSTISLISGCSSTTVEEVDTGGDNLNNLKINVPVKKHVLKNGLKVLIVENKKLPIYSFYTYFDVGGRHESAGTTGATHFLEHMMFKGAKKYGPGKFDTAIEANGGSTNAYTTFDSTVYYENMPSHTIEDIIDMEADRLQNLLLEEKAFEKERNVILEERRYRYENSPKGKLYLKMMQEVFKGTPYGGSVIGSVKDLKSLSREQVRKFFKQFYAPNNAIIVVVGDVDSEKIIESIEKKYGDIPASKTLSKLKRRKDNQALYSFKRSLEDAVGIKAANENPIFILAYKGEKLGTRRAFVMDILSSVLGDGESSYLYKKYVKSNSPQLTNISVANYNLKYNGVFFLMGELLPGVDLRTFRRELLNELDNVCENAINSRSVLKTKNQYLVSYYDELQTNKGVASFIGLRESLLGDYKFYKKELEIYNSIKKEELVKECKNVFVDRDQIFLSVWDKHTN